MENEHYRFIDRLRESALIAARFVALDREDTQEP